MAGGRPPHGLSAFQINWSHFHPKPFLGQPLVVTLFAKKMQAVSHIPRMRFHSHQRGDAKCLGQGHCVKAGWTCCQSKLLPKIYIPLTKISMWMETPPRPGPSNSEGGCSAVRSWRCGCMCTQGAACCPAVFRFPELSSRSLLCWVPVTSARLAQG